MTDSTQPNGHLPAHVRRVQALLAGGAARKDGLTDDLDDLERFIRIVDAWDDEMRPMTRPEVALAAGLDHDPSFEDHFDRLHHYGAVVQHRHKAGTIKWTPNPIALISAQLLADLADESAADRLTDLIILALDRITAKDVTAAEVLGIGERLTRAINVVTAAMNRAVDVGTIADVIEATPSKHVQEQVARVEDVVATARHRFDQITHRLLDLAAAANSFLMAADRMVSRLADPGAELGAAGLFGLLEHAEVDATARTATVERLATVASDLVVDAPRQVFTRQGLADAVDEIGAPPQPRPPVPIPDVETAADPLEVIDGHRHAAARRQDARRRWVTGLLADDDAAVLAEDVWPAPVQRLVDALSVADEATVPVTADLARRVQVDGYAPVAAITPVRLRRLGTTEAADGSVPQEATDECR